jgi:hypothetical protein
VERKNFKCFQKISRVRQFFSHEPRTVLEICPPVDKKFDGPGDNFDEVVKNRVGPDQSFDGPGEKFDGPGDNFDEVVKNRVGPDQSFDGPGKSLTDLVTVLSKLSKTVSDLIKVLTDLVTVLSKLSKTVSDLVISLPDLVSKNNSFDGF